MNLGVCEFVFVNLCICEFVFVNLCICEFVFLCLYDWDLDDGFGRCKKAVTNCHHVLSVYL